MLPGSRFAGEASAQLRLTGQASPAYIKSDDGYSQYITDAGRATFAWRLDLFADAAISDNVFFLSNLRIVQDQIFHIDLLALKLTDIAGTGVNVEAGEIDLPFGSLGERRFPKNNPFYRLPLLHEHLTTLRSSNYQLWIPDARYTRAGDGIRLVDQGLYDVGAKLYGGVGIFDYWVAVINGMVSATSTYSTNYGLSGLNSKKGLGTIIRIAATPMTGLTIGSSYATGAFLDEYGGTDVYGTAYHSSDIRQHALEADVDFSIEHLRLYAEGIYNVWTFTDLLGSDLTALGYSIEGEYTVVPRVTVAARAGELFFNTIDALIPGLYGAGPYAYSGRWDHNVLRIEGALGYRVERAVLVKAVYESNTALGVTEDPPDNTLVIQAVVSF
jgi:hypothetical protein